MSVKTFNESFKMLYGDIKHNSKPLQESFQSELTTALNDRAEQLMSKGTSNIKEYEMAFQEVIENLEPDKLWWEVTDLNIFYDLFENRDVMGCVNRIIDNLKPQYKDEVVSESIDYAKQLVDRAKKDNRNISYKDAKEVIDQSFNDKVDNIESFYKNLTFDEKCNKKVKGKESLNEAVGMDHVLEILLHKYSKQYDRSRAFDEDLNDFIDQQTTYSSDCLDWFKHDVNEMFLYGMQHCEAIDSYTRDFDDFVRGAISDLVAENISKFEEIYNGTKERDDAEELNRIRNKQ